MRQAGIGLAYKRRAEAGRDTRRFRSAGDASKEIQEGFNAWSSGLSQYSLQMILALIAANWAVHGSQNIQSNLLAQLSMVLAVVHLGVRLICTTTMLDLYRRRVAYAGQDRSRWDSEYRKDQDKNSEWPYTDGISLLAQFTAAINFYLPLASGIFLVLSIVLTETQVGSGIGTNASRGAYIWAVESAWLWLALAICGVATMIGSVHLLVSGDIRAKAAGALLATITLLSAGGLVMFKDLKFENLFSLNISLAKTPAKKDHPIDPPGLRDVGVGMRRVASIENFELKMRDRIALAGATVPIEQSPAVKVIAAEWLAGRRQGKTGVLMLIGSADRLPLSGATAVQFDANVGLARARGEATKEVIMRALEREPRDLQPKADEFLVLTSGPTQTGTVPKGTANPPSRGHPEDRRVDVWIFWSQIPSSIDPALAQHR